MRTRGQGRTSSRARCSAKGKTGDIAQPVARASAVLVCACEFAVKAPCRLTIGGVGVLWSREVTEMLPPAIDPNLRQPAAITLARNPLQRGVSARGLRRRVLAVLGGRGLAQIAVPVVVLHAVDVVDHMVWPATAGHEPNYSVKAVTHAVHRHREITVGQGSHDRSGRCPRARDVSRFANPRADAARYDSGVAIVAKQLMRALRCQLVSGRPFFHAPKVSRFGFSVNTRRRSLLPF